MIASVKAHRRKSPLIRSRILRVDLSDATKGHFQYRRTTHVPQNASRAHRRDRHQRAGLRASAADIVDTAVAAGSFTTLVAAVQAAGLVETLKGEGPFTVFAPTDEAFAALPAGTVENLLKPENKDQLVAILTYHVVPGKVMSTDLTNGMKAATVHGANVTITTRRRRRRSNGANVVTADIEASNGVDPRDRRGHPAAGRLIAPVRENEGARHIAGPLCFSAVPCSRRRLTPPGRASASSAGT